MAQNPEKGHLVLAGDPKQLGPIIRSPHALQYGLGETGGIALLFLFYDKILNNRRFGFTFFPSRLNHTIR